MHNMSMFHETPEDPVPRPVFSQVREYPGHLLCDMTWESDNGGSSIFFFDLWVALMGVPCSSPGCEGQYIRGTIPGHTAFLVCCRCQDLNPRWQPVAPNAETYSTLAERLLRQIGQPSKPGELPRPGDGAIAERAAGGEPVRSIARALEVPPQRIRRRLKRLKRTLPGLFRLNQHPPLSIIKQEDMSNGTQDASNRGRVQEAPTRQGTNADAACRSGGHQERGYHRQPGEGALRPAREHPKQDSASVMPEQLTPAELLQAAEAAIRANHPDSHIRKAAIDHLNHSREWIKELERLKGRPPHSG